MRGLKQDPSSGVYEFPSSQYVRMRVLKQAAEEQNNIKNRK